MANYLEKVKAELQHFSKYQGIHIDREDNTNADALAKLATSKDADLLYLIPVEVVREPSISRPNLVESITEEPSWMDELIAYLKEDKLPDDRE